MSASPFEERKASRQQAIGEVVMILLILLMKMNLSLVGPDDFMRASWLADNIAQGHFLPLPFYPRDGGPEGLILHWGYSWNLILEGLAALPAALIGWRAAFAFISPIVGAALLIGEMVLASWMVSGVGDDKIKFEARCALLVMTTIIGPPLGSIDHHQAVAAAVMLGIAVAVHAFRHGGAIWFGVAGGLLPLAADISPDAVPSALLTIGLVALAVQRYPERGAGARCFTASLISMSFLVLVLDPPPSGVWSFEPFHYSIMHASLLAMPALAAAAAVAGSAKERGAWSGAFVVGLVMAVSVTLWAWLFRHRLFGADFYGMPPEIMERIAEQRGIDTFDRAARILIPTFMALPGPGLMLIRAQDSREKVLWAGAIIALVGITTVTAFHLRFCPYQQTLCAPLIAISAWRLTEAWRAWKPVRANKQVVMKGIYVLVALAAGAYVLFGPPVESPNLVAASCRLGPVASSLNQMLPAGDLVMGDVFISPEILYRTKFRTLAGPYQGHPGNTLRAYLDVINATDLSEDGVALQQLKALGVDALVVCPDSYEAQAFISEKGLGHSIKAGQAPSWLKEVPWPAGVKTGLRVFRVL
jgi:hypothetical protein